MIQIHSSASLQLLADQCAENVNNRGLEDPFTPHTILVPNLDSARWLRLKLTERNGILANSEFMLPAEWLWKQVRKLHPGLPKMLASDRGPLKWSLYQLLSDEQTNQKFPVLYRYIASQKEVSRDQALYQLSGKLASLFDEYLIYRPEMVNRWERGADGSGDEKWQAELWRTLIQFWSTELGAASPQNRAHLFIETEHALKRAEIRPEPSIMVFNTGLMPSVILRSLQHCGSHSDVRFYIVEPSKELKSPENQVFRSYGEDARNIAKLYSSVVGERKKLHSDIFNPDSLGNIQRSIFLDESVPKANPNDDLASVQIRSCHSRLREIEVLHDFLLEQFEKDSTLAPDDIAVVTPNPEKYKPFVDAVFNHKEEGLPVIPTHMGNNRSGSGIGKSVLRLLGLLDSRFSFDSVMDLFQSDPVRNSFGVSETQAIRVKRWMQENHVVWGLDGKHRGEWNQPKKTHQTWKSALDRGWLGQWIGENEDEDNLYYHRIESVDEQELWAVFSMYMRKLQNAARSAKSRKTLQGWVEWLRTIQSIFFTYQEEQNDGAKPLQYIFDVLNDMVSAGTGSAEIPFRVFKTELEQLIDKAGASGAVFTRGVTFSSMVPLRSIPFKVVALIGLNDQEFPRKNISPDFDLMARNPQPGERNHKLEDRNLFLESIMAAQKVHYCSYIGQSPEDNEIIPPSTIVSEWAGILSECTGKQPDEIIQKEPLTGFSPSSYDNRPAYSGRYLNALKKMTEDEGVSGLISTASLQLPEEENHISTDDLIRFFKNPMQYFINARFGSILREEDAEKEEFSLDHLELHLLMQKVFHWVLAEEKRVTIQKRLSLSGILPDGWPGKKMVDEMIHACSASIAVLEQQKITPATHYREITVYSGDTEITGHLSSYSNERMVDVNLSKPAGRILIQSWVKHILWNVAESKQESYLICNIKKGEPSLFRFKIPDNPDELLSGLITLFKSGFTEPIPFFPDTLDEYLNAKTVEKGLEKASKAFEGGFYHGERDHQAIKILMGPEVPFDESFMKPEFLKMMSEMRNHTEEVS